MERFTRNSVILSIEKGAYLFFGMGLMVAVARFLGQEELGSYAYAISLTALFVPILDLGMNNRIILVVALREENANDSFSKAISLKILLAPAVISTMGVIVWASGKPLEVLVFVLLVGSSTIVMSLGDAVNSLFKGLQRPNCCVMLVGVTNAVLFGLGIVTMVTGVGLLGVGVCYLLCRVSYFGTGLFLIHRIAPNLFPSFRSKIRWNLFKNGLRYLPTSYFLGNLVNLNFIIADRAVDELTSGQFAIGYRFAVSMFVLVSATLEAVLPMLTQRFGQGRELRSTIVKLFKLFFGTSLIFVGIVQLIAYPLTVWVFGSDYGSSVKAIQLLVWTLPPFALCGLAHTVLMAIGHEVKGAWIMLGLVVTGTGLGVAVIPFWGILGTALIPSVTGCLFGGILWGFVWKELKKMEEDVSLL